MTMSDDSRLIDDILTAVMDRIRLNRSVPRSTYRVQLNNKFTFRDATALVPYLARLGISHMYASPYLKASPGSTHGYDVIDHCRLNPELGTPDDYEKMISALREHGMLHIADIVPNHVGIATNENVWWNEVLENGPASIYAEYFDINWAGSPLTDLTGRVLVPILAAAFGEELEKGNLRLSFDGGGFFVSYHQRRFPISPRSFPMILSDDGPREIQSILTECKALSDRCQGLPSQASDTRKRTG
jgi:(1->4)-alpha-D-glucan 1-alpha-D-glucosylmutase